MKDVSFLIRALFVLSISPTLEADYMACVGDSEHLEFNDHTSQSLLYTPDPSLASDYELTTRYGITGKELEIIKHELSSGFSDDTVYRYKVGSQAFRYSKLALAVYENSPSLIDWVITDESIERLPGEFDPNTATMGFHGILFESRKVQHECVVAFEGTDPLDAGDIVTDVFGLVLPTNQIGRAHV